MEALAHEVPRQLDLATEAEFHLLPALDLVEVYPQLRLGQEDKFGVLPCSRLTPEVGKAVEREPMVEEVEVSHTRNLEVVFCAESFVVVSRSRAADSAQMNLFIGLGLF